MKILSLRQPWCEIVLAHGKRIENRTWNTEYRGPFLIHASRGMTPDEFDAAMDCLDDVNGLQPPDVMRFDELQRGGIVGRARLIDVVRPRPAIVLTGLDTYYPESLRTPLPEFPRVSPWCWHFPEQYGFVLADVERVPFTPCRGYPSLFDAQLSLSLKQIAELSYPESRT